MQQIKLWALEMDGATGRRAEPVNAVHNTETENMLEELLVSTPDLLMSDLALVGRQTPTKGGPLDLLGIDEEGRLVLFELKRGTLTREAVTQAIDYASDLAERDTESLGEHIADRSGYLGIEKIDDFSDWYAQNFTGSEENLEERPRIVLVGLGADGRARRMVNFLADAGVDIQLLTFHAFERNGQQLLARQVETRKSDGRTGTTSVTRKDNLEALAANAEKLGVHDFLERVKKTIAENMPAYVWPAKTGYSFGFAERTNTGNPTCRVYTTVRLNPDKPGTLRLTFFRRALDAGGEQIERFREQLADRAAYIHQHTQLRVELTPDTWDSTSAQLLPVLAAIEAGWKNRQSEEEGTEMA